MDRRTLLANAIAATPIALSLGVVACSTTTPVTATQLASDTNLLASGLSVMLTQIQTMPNVSLSTIAKVQAYVAIVQNDAAAVAAATANPPPSIVQQIAQAVQAVANVVLPMVPNGSAINAIVTAALALLPTILADVGVAADSNARYVKMTPEHARMILARASH